jgi:hypothetical protein
MTDYNGNIRTPLSQEQMDVISLLSVINGDDLKTGDFVCDTINGLDTANLFELIGGVIPNAYLPPVSLTKPTVYTNIASRDADESNLQEGDVSIVIDVQKSYIYFGTYNVDGAYIELVATGTITCINGLCGAVISIDTSNIPEAINLYYTEARVSANADLISNSNRITSLETYYESASSETCDEVFPVDGIVEINSLSQGTSFTPVAGTYRLTFDAQFELTKGGTVISRAPDALISLIDQLEALTYTARVLPDYGNGETLLAGNYHLAGATTHTGVLNFDAKGNEDAVFVISCGAAHTAGVGSSTVLLNDARACNIFYVVVGALSFGTGSTIRGTYAGKAAVSVGVGSSLDGRLFTIAGAVTTGNVMALPVNETKAFDLGVISQFVLFDTFGDITNPAVATNPSIINSGLVACGNGTVLGFPPYDATYTYTALGNPTLRVGFGIYNGGVLVGVVKYLENTIPSRYYSISLAKTVISTGLPISARISVDSLDGSIIITDRTLFARKI